MAFPVQLLCHGRPATISHPGSGGSQAAPVGSPNPNRNGSDWIDEAFPSALAFARVLLSWMSSFFLQFWDVVGSSWIFMDLPDVTRAVLVR